MKTPVFLLAFVLCGFAAVNSFAATLVVTKTADTNDGTCDADCSLREAVAVASADDMIFFSSLFNTPHTITLTLGNIAITRNLTISGPGPATLTISGNNASRIFHISGGVMVNVSGMKLTNGLSAPPNEGGGGAVFISDSSANMTSVNISNNVAHCSQCIPYGYGGGIYVLRGSVSLNNSVISGNTAVVTNSGAGGGIYGSFSQVHVTNSTISYNQPQGIRVDGESGNPSSITATNCNLTNNSGTAIGNGSGSTVVTSSIIRSNGGGIGGGDLQSSFTIDKSVIRDNEPFGGVGVNGTASINETSIDNNSSNGVGAVGGGIGIVGTAYVLNSSITNNRAFDRGGGIFTGGASQIYLTNSTVSGNAADNGSGNCDCPGGGIYVGGPGGNFVLTNSTVAQNRSGGLGGGVYNNSMGIVTLRNSIIAGNLSPTSTKDASGTMSSEGFNLVGNTTGSSGWIGSDLLNRDPMLAPLGNNGGMTVTQPILPGSPAANAGNNDLARDPYDNSLLQFDQRDKGYPRAVNSTVDIGAYEANYALNPVTLAGRVLVSPSGRGIPRAFITLTDTIGNVLYTQTNPFGYYRFLNLSPGTTFTIRVSHKSYVFDSPQVVTIDQPRYNLDFVAEGQ